MMMMMMMMTDDKKEDDKKAKRKSKRDYDKLRRVNRRKLEGEETGRERNYYIKLIQHQSSLWNWFVGNIYLKHALTMLGLNQKLMMMMMMMTTMAKLTQCKSYPRLSGLICSFFIQHLL